MKAKITIKTQNSMYVLPFDKVIYMEKELRKVKVHTVLEDFPCIEFYSRFEDLYDIVDERFMRSHRSYLINMEKIIVMSNPYIYVEGNKRICMGRETFRRARQEFDEFLAKEMQ